MVDCIFRMLRVSFILQTCFGKYAKSAKVLFIVLCALCGDL